MSFSSRVGLFLAVLGFGLLLGAGSVLADVNAFVYHRFGDGRYPSTNISLDRFRQHLQTLKQGGYNVVTLGKVAHQLKAGTLPERTAVITIDDAFSSFYDNGIPLLQEFGYPATLFVTSDLVGRAGYLSWDQLRELQTLGIEIGNHSAAHQHYTYREAGESQQQWLTRVREDLQRSQQAFATHLGEKPALLAYPYGEFTPEVIAVVQQLGFTGAAAQQSGVISSASNLFALPRFPMGGPYTGLEAFKRKLAMKGLPVKTVANPGPLWLKDVPPVYRFTVDRPQNLRFGAFNCFVQGQNRCTVTEVPEQPGVYEVTAEQPLAGRRNKYTLTARGSDGRWYWHSVPWFNTNQPE